MHRPYHLKRGIFLVTLGWLAFSSLYMMTKLIGPHTTIPTMVFFRSVFGLLVIAPWLIKHFPKGFKIHNKTAVLTRSALGLLNLAFMFLSLRNISLVDATLLNNTAPFFVPLLLLFFLKKPVKWKIWPAIVIGFIGVGFVLHPDRRLLRIEAIYAILSAVCLAGSLITMRLAAFSEKLFTFMFYYFTIGIIGIAPFALLNWSIPSWPVFLGLFSIGIFSFLGQMLLFFGLKQATAHQLAPFTYTTVLFSAVYEWLIWGQTPPPIALAGAILVISAGIWIVWVSRVPKED